MLFNLNIKKLAVLLLPTFLRKPTQIKWLWALLKPLEQIYDLFVNFRKENLYKLSITSQKCYLERALNNRFDPELRRIFIDDGNRFQRLYIYTEAEEKPVYIYTEEEIAAGAGQFLYLYQEDDFADTGVDFIVFAPAELLNENNYEMKSLINYYKLASKRYKITGSTQ